MKKTSHEQKIVYHPNMVIRMIFVFSVILSIFAVFIVIHALLNDHVPFERKLSLSASMGFVSLSLVLLVSILLTRLEVTPAGIAYRGIGFSIYAP